MKRAGLVVAPLRRAVILFALALLGCPGSARLPPKRDGVLTPLPDFGSWPTLDVGTPKKEGGTPGSDFKVTTTPGGPCPCKTPLLCVKQACREACTQLICNGSTCAAGAFCAMTTAGTPVCVPASATAGQACSQSAPCASGALCLGPPGDTAGKCFSTCTGPDQPCASCTQIQGSQCSYCAE